MLIYPTFEEKVVFIFDDVYDDFVVLQRNCLFKLQYQVLVSIVTFVIRHKRIQAIYRDRHKTFSFAENCFMTDAGVILKW